MTPTQKHYSTRADELIVPGTLVCVLKEKSPIYDGTIMVRIGDLGLVLGPSGNIIKVNQVWIPKHNICMNFDKEEVEIL